jgi:hypothetical protein
MTPKLFVRALRALLWVSVFCPAQEITVAAAADLQRADQHSGEPDLCELQAVA